MQARLLKRAIDSLIVNGSDYVVWDTQLSGFGIRVSPNGRKTFLIQYRFHGKSKRVSLGKYGLLPIS